jgi:hypothetical protein
LVQRRLMHWMAEDASRRWRFGVGCVPFTHIGPRRDQIFMRLLITLFTASDYIGCVMIRVVSISPDVSSPVPLLFITSLSSTLFSADCLIPLSGSSYEFEFTIICSFDFSTSPLLCRYVMPGSYTSDTQNCHKICEPSCDLRGYIQHHRNPDLSPCCLVANAARLTQSKSLSCKCQGRNSAILDCSAYPCHTCPCHSS